LYPAPLSRTGQVPGFDFPPSVLVAVEKFPIDSPAAPSLLRWRRDTPTPDASEPHGVSISEELRAFPSPFRLLGFPSSRELERFFVGFLRFCVSSKLTRATTLGPALFAYCFPARISRECLPCRRLKISFPLAPYPTSRNIKSWSSQRRVRDRVAT